jgi:hypothetical protein
LDLTMNSCKLTPCLVGQRNFLRPGILFACNK